MTFPPLIQAPLRAGHRDLAARLREDREALAGQLRSSGAILFRGFDVTEPARVVAIVTRESVEELGLAPGMSAAGVVKSTSVMVER